MRAFFRPGVLSLEIREESLRLVKQNGHAIDTFFENLAEVVESENLEGCFVTILLPTERILMKPISLFKTKNVSERDTEIKDNLCDYFPFALDSLHYDYYTIDTRDSLQDTVLLFATSSVALEHDLTLINAAGLKVSRITTDIAALSGNYLQKEINLLPWRITRKDWIKKYRSFLLAAITLFTLLGMIIHIAIHQWLSSQQAILSDLQNQLTELRQKASSSTDFRPALSNIKQEHRSIAIIVKNILDQAPSDMLWLNMRYQTGVLHVEGLSDTASILFDWIHHWDAILKKYPIDLVEMHYLERSAILGFSLRIATNERPLLSAEKHDTHSTL